MPTYEYRCAVCGDFEAVHGMKDPSLAACPTCGKPVTRLISKGGGLIFKGSGFYITDYRSAEYKEKAAGESAGAKPAAPGDAKPAAPGASGTASSGITGAPSGDSRPSASAPAPGAGSGPASPAAPATSGGTGSSSSSPTT